MMINQNYFISTEILKLDIAVIADFLQNDSYWASSRSLSTIKKSIENSLCFGVYTNQGQQVGFARVVSDFAVFAWIMDLFILKSHRNNGLGKMLMKEIINHPNLQGLQRWGLGTNDAHGVYEKFGFRIIANPDLMMEKVCKSS